MLFFYCFRKITYGKKKTLTQSLPEFLDFMLIFLLLMANFWPVPLNPAQEK